MDKFQEHDPRCGRETEGQWYSQPQDIALADTPEFSQRFFAEVFNEFPALATSVVFLRWSVQPDTSTQYLTSLAVGLACRLIRG
jgi:hypothetical protein